MYCKSVRETFDIKCRRKLDSKYATVDFPLNEENKTQGQNYESVVA